MTKSVLCAVDVSDGDVDSPVLKEAVQLADMHGAQLDVITVLPDFGNSLVSGFFKPDFHKHAEEEAAKHLQALCLATLGEERNKSVRHVVATGPAYKEILTVAENAGTDLIVIGAHKPDMKDFLLGPNAARIINHSQCSVYVVR
ncbi:universal stress protein [Sedimentitalea todarodis]|uniref:Universal stress protein n=1 Tax=Sedimentitalea todarodis TaxID=1631240 RepID=A0ABU3VAX1_9RHOB|nr:universal stress protein [Sedimentitalea todarodis]MDU9003316.1 universal stress protein [Sedimentitalea todarodis]